MLCCQSPGATSRMVCRLSPVVTSTVPHMLLKSVHDQCTPVCAYRLSQEDMATADATLSPKSFRRSRLGTTSNFDKTVGSATTRSFTATRSFNATSANADRAIDRNLSLSATARIAATTPAAEKTDHATYGSQSTASISFGGTANTDADDAAVCTSIGVSGKGGRRQRLSELLQNPEPATPRRHGT